MSWRRCTPLAAALAAIALYAAPPAHGGDPTFWTAGTGDWLDANNWSAGLPVFDANAFIDNGGTAQLSAGVGQVDRLTLGGAGAGTLSWTGGGLQAAAVTLAPNGLLIATLDWYCPGELSVDGGAIALGAWGLMLEADAPATMGAGSIDAGRLYVGDHTSASFLQNGGTVHVAEYGAGVEAGAVGTHELLDGNLIVDGTLDVGRSGVGSFVQSGGWAHADDINIGAQTDSNGTWHLAGGQVTVDGTAVVGSQGLGRLHQTGGGISARLLAVGFYPSSRGSYELEDGNLTLSDNLYLGIQGAAHFVQSGGRTEAKHFYVGSTDPDGGLCELSGGQIVLSGNLFTGIGGKGHFHQSGGTVAAKDLHVGSEPGSRGEYELLDGNVLLTGQLYVGVGADATFTQSGGSLQAARITVGDQVDSNGLYLLSDGLISTPASLLVGVRGTGAFAQTGGHVTARRLMLGYDLTGAVGGGLGSYQMDSGELLLGTVTDQAALRVAAGSTFTQTGGLVVLSGADLLLAPDAGAGLAFCDLRGGQFQAVAVAPDANHPEDLRGGNLVVNALDGEAMLSVASADVRAGRLLVAAASGSSPATQAIVHLDAGRIFLTGEGSARDANYYSVGSDVAGRIEGHGTIVSPAGLFLRDSAVLAPTGGMLTLDAPLGSLMDESGVLTPRQTVPNAVDIPAGAGLRARGQLTGPVQNAGTLAAYGGSLYLHGDVVNTGTLGNAPGAAMFVHAASLVHTGDVEAGAGGIVSFDQPITALAGRSISLTGGTVAAPQITVAPGGALSGSGTVAAAVVNQGSADFYGFAQIFGTVLNAAGAGLNVWNGDLLVVGDTTNDGHVKVLNGRATFQGALAGSGTIDIDPATVFVAGDLSLAAAGVLTADANSTLELMRSFLNASTRAEQFDLSQAAVSFRGSASPADPQVLEAAGQDLGAVDEGWVDNFAFGKLVITPSTWVSLADAADNRLDGPANEALYVGQLVLGPIDFHNVNLYYRNGGPNKRLIYGDADLNGEVNYEDYKAILRHFGGPIASWGAGDFDFDGDVDYEDYKTMLANFGANSTDAPGALPPHAPEPATLLLLLLGAAAFSLRRKRH